MHIILNKTIIGFCLGAAKSPAKTSLTLYYALRKHTHLSHRQDTGRLRTVSQLTSVSEVKPMLGKRAA